MIPNLGYVKLNATGVLDVKVVLGIIQPVIGRGTLRVIRESCLLDLPGELVLGDTRGNV